METLDPFQRKRLQNGLLILFQGSATNLKPWHDKEKQIHQMNTFTSIIDIMTRLLQHGPLALEDVFLQFWLWSMMQIHNRIFT